MKRLLCCEGHNLLAPGGLLLVCPINGLKSYFFWSAALLYDTGDMRVGMLARMPARIRPQRANSRNTQSKLNYDSALKLSAYIIL